MNLTPRKMAHNKRGFLGSIPLAVVAGVFAVSVLFGIGNTHAASKVARVGFSDPLTADHALAMQTFKVLVESQTNGNVEVQLFPSNQLGRELQQMENVRSGTQQVYLATPEWFASFFPKIEVLVLPFLYPNWETGIRVFRSDVFADLAKEAEQATGIRIAGGFPTGFREMYNSKRPITTLADLKGMKIRLQSAQVHIKTFAALGANPVAMPAEDIYQAIKTGTLDGAETPPPIMVGQGYAEVAPYISLTHHFFSGFLFYVNPAFHDGLTPSERAVFDSAIKSAAATGFVLARNAEGKALAALRDKGGKVNELSDSARQELRNAVKPVYDEFGPKLEPYFSRIMELTKAK